MQQKTTDYYSAADMRNEICIHARKILGHGGTCDENCPFAGCIGDLQPQKVKMILKTKKLIAILDDIHNNASKDSQHQIAKRHGIEDVHCNRYRKNLDSYYELLLGYGIVKELGI